MKKSYLFLTVVLLAVVMFAGCADVIPVEECVKAATKDTPYGFWGGLWHGLTSFFSFFGQLFSDNIAIYSVNNNGDWYNFGFVLGAGILLGGCSQSRK